MASAPLAPKRKKFPARIATAYDGVREKRLARKVAMAHLKSSFGVEVEDVEADEWLDDDLSLSFDRPVEVYIDCPEKVVRKPGVLRCLFLMEPLSSARARANLGDFHYVFGRNEVDRFFGFGGSWVPRSLLEQAFPKTRTSSMICGDKMDTEGHRLRRQVYDHLPPNVTRFASSRVGTTTSNLDIRKSQQEEPLGKEIAAKAREAVGPFRYHVAVENVCEESYFSEKLIDCLLLRTVPVYWGCPNLGDFFDLDGIVHVVTAGCKSAADAVLDALRAELADDEANYARRRQAIETNFTKAHDWIDLQGRMQRAIDAALEEEEEEGGQGK